jgi:hypothetical protein
MSMTNGLAASAPASGACAPAGARHREGRGALRPTPPAAPRRRAQRDTHAPRISGARCQPSPRCSARPAADRLPGGRAPNGRIRPALSGQAHYPAISRPPGRPGSQSGPLWDTSVHVLGVRGGSVQRSLARPSMDTRGPGRRDVTTRVPLCLVRAAVRRRPPPCRATQTPLLIAIGQGSPDHRGRVLLTPPAGREDGSAASRRPIGGRHLIRRSPARPCPPRPAASGRHRDPPGRAARCAS